MTAADYAARCTAAKLDVLAARVEGRLIVVEVAPLTVTVETVRARLTTLGAGGVTFATDGTGHDELRFVAGDGA